MTGRACHLGVMGDNTITGAGFFIQSLFYLTASVFGANPDPCSLKGIYPEFQVIRGFSQ